ncbi:MAG: 5-formyltetrahydrofolate cyclo-ligase [Chitinophagaceae bacterium]
MIKTTVRKEFLQRRQGIFEEEFQQQTVLIGFNFKKLKIPSVDYLLSYSPITERHEFDVSVCEDMLQQQYPMLKLAWPRIEPVASHMEAIQVDKKSVLVKNKHNVLEPADGIIVDPQRLDIVFVPLLAFDDKGYRVGYGKGYYDRFLARCRPDIIKIGFSFFEAVESIEDMNEFDVPLNFCITPRRIYEF